MLTCNIVQAQPFFSVRDTIASGADGEVIVYYSIPAFTCSRTKIIKYLLQAAIIEHIIIIRRRSKIEHRKKIEHAWKKNNK